MALLQIHNTFIVEIKIAVSSKKIIIKVQKQYFDSETVEEILQKTGIEERRFVPEGMCTSDLCYAAPDKLLNDGK